MVFKVHHGWYDGPQVAVLRQNEDGEWVGFGYFDDSMPLIEAMEALDPDWGTDSWPEGEYEWDGLTFRSLS